MKEENKPMSAEEFYRDKLIENTEKKQKNERL